MNLYEAHIPVSDLARSITFYRDIVGLELAFRVPERQVAFMWIGSKEESMLGLWGPGADYGWKEGEAFRTHFAMSVTLDELLEMPAKLKALGVVPRGFGGEPADEPSVLGWMPSAQIYFRDPDNHSLEYITILEGETDPGFIGSWSEWNRR